MKITLRKAFLSDCRTVFKWINDESVRAVSFSQKPIPWHVHSRWFHSRILDANFVYYIAISEEKQPVGQIRFEIMRNEAIVSVLVPGKWRNRGIGTKIIEMGSQKILKTGRCTKIHAYIKKSNLASQKSFEHARYQKAEDELYGGELSRHYIFTDSVSVRTGHAYSRYHLKNHR